jgi:hypothetical protein
MKKSSSFSLALALVIFVCSIPGFSQTAGECEQLRKDIRQLEQLELGGMSATLQQLYKESLLKLYVRFDSCLEKEISTERQANGERSQATLAALLKEKADNDGKLTIMRVALNLPDLAKSATSEIASKPVAVDDRSSTPEPANSETSSTRPTAPNPFVSTAASTRLGSLSASRRNLTPSAPVPQDCSTVATYVTAPGILKDLASGLAADIISQNNPDIAAQAGPQMVLYAVFDGASPRSSELVHSLESYHYLGETARTDKQLGGSANSDGAVSSIEKPGFAQLLGFALEHGGLTKENDGTNLTLSTSLYSLYTMGKKDTAANYQKAGFLNRVGLAATFAVDNQDNDLANARRNNLSEWSAKVRLFGDRSSRSPGFQKLFDQKVRPLIRERLRTLGRAIEDLASKNPKYDTLEGNALDTLPDEVRARMACPDFAATPAAQKQQILADVILSRLGREVYQPLNTRSFQLGADEIARIEGEFLPNLKRTLDNLVLADDALKQAFNDLQKGPLATFAYTNHRDPLGSDYSEAKFLFEQEKGFMGPLKLTGNAGLTLYNRPNPLLNQQRIRDFAAALSFEGTTDSPFTEAENRSKITYSFVGRYQRFLENRNALGRTPDVGSLQFVTEIPLFKGLSIPFSITYSNATEEQKKEGFRFNFGTRFDMDKLVQILGAVTAKP